MEDQTVERERGEEKREEEKEEEKKKRREEEGEKFKQDQRYGTTKLEYGSLVCMIIILPKPRVFLGFHLNPIIMESMVGKTLNSTRKV